MNIKINLDMLGKEYQVLFEVLESKRKEGNISNEEKIELAMIYINLEEGEQALTIYEEILEEYPQNAQAKMWFAHFNLHYRSYLEENIYVSLKLAEEIIKLGDETAAFGHSIKSHGLDELGQTDRRYEQIEALQKSVQLCPHWNFNHEHLAILYEKEGRVLEAIEQYEKAGENYIDDFDPDWGPTKRYFEAVITGRVVGELHKRGRLRKIEELRKLL